MGILNVTPDSFSDGGRYMDVSCAVQRAEEMLAQGADIIDIGGESTRPGAEPVSIDEEMKRVLPIVEAIKDIAYVSVDTSKPEVMKQALLSGAKMINDINGLEASGAVKIVSELQADIVIMHKQGSVKTMQQVPCYTEGVIPEIYTYFKKRLNLLQHEGVDLSRVMIDPGFGFGKTVSHNLEIIKNINAFRSLNCPILLGVSRKSTLGVITGKPVESRTLAGLILGQYALLQGVSVLRTHDVLQTKEMINVLSAILNTESYRKIDGNEE